MINDLSHKIRTILKNQETMNKVTFRERDQSIESAHSNNLTTQKLYPLNHIQIPDKHHTVQNSKNNSTHTLSRKPLSFTPNKVIMNTSREADLSSERYEEGYKISQEFEEQNHGRRRKSNRPSSKAHQFSSKKQRNSHHIDKEEEECLAQQIYRKVKSKLLSFFEPILQEIQEKYQIFTEVEERMRFLEEQSQTQIDSLSQKLDQVEKYLTKMDEHKKREEKIDKLNRSQSPNKNRHQTEPNNQYQFDRKSEQFDEVRVKIRSLEERMGEISRIQTKIQKLERKEESMIDIVLKQQKCSCKNLVDQILKSQEHLTMEMKYIKHFQGLNRPYQNQTQIK